MKKIVLATILATVGSASALAADSSAPTYGKSPVMVEPAFNWSGFYIGGNIGRHWGRDQITSTADAAGGLGLGVDGAAAIDAASPTSLRPQGFIGGIQAGYNWQVNTVVFGFEADANWLGGTASRTLHGIPVINPGDFMTNSASATFLATFRPRVGLVFDRAL